MEGGADTTSLFLRSFVLMLVAFPEVQRKAQEEIDVVIGSYRVPSPEDYDNLPYVQAVVKEVRSTVSLLMLYVLELEYVDFT